MLPIKKILPDEYKNLIKKLFWAGLAILRLKRIYWKLKRNKLDVELRLGYKNCKKLFAICCRYHKKILKENDYKIRDTLYTELYDTIFDFLKTHAPGSTTFGFKPDIITKNLALFDT